MTQKAQNEWQEQIDELKEAVAELRAQIKRNLVDIAQIKYPANAEINEQQRNETPTP